MTGERGTDFGAPSTANLCDAALALNVEIRLVTRHSPVSPEWRTSGVARCVRHFGSVDIFLEAIDQATPGEVLVIDNEGRDDEGCAGDLVTLEAKIAGLAGIIIWGRHRDSTELRKIGFPVFSLGSCSTGPQRLDPREAEFGSARVGDLRVQDGDHVVADADGLLVFRPGEYQMLEQKALEIRRKEAEQSEAMRHGQSLRALLALDEYVSRRNANPSLTFREHLQARRAAIEV